MAIQEWLDEGESVIDSWSIYILKAASVNNSAGKIYVTNKNFRFDIQTSMVNSPAGLMLANDGRHLVVPYSEIAKVELQTQLLIMKNLKLELKSGEVYVFRFGILSPAKAIEEIQKRIN
ncbi:MAG: hypothetical protein COA79_07310 [Planctomycetota bacterium]|nr:MAG: hypothetical protein COA79_07310 [Planctomycetota bacterium]